MNKDIRRGLAWAGTMLVVSIAAVTAKKLGYIDSDTTVRLCVGLNGLMIASYGNRMPKTLAPDGCARQATRVGGWAFVISGYFYAALWAFAPIKVAGIVGTGALILGMGVMLGYCYWLRAQAKAA